MKREKCLKLIINELQYIDTSTLEAILKTVQHLHKHDSCTINGTRTDVLYHHRTTPKELLWKMLKHN